jgi:prophage antirepressor-like protein
MPTHPTLILHPSLEDAQLAFFYEETEKQFYFRGVDAAKSLGYANPSRSLRQLVDKDWIVMKDDGTAKGNKVLYLTEAGFYQLCFASKLPQAQVFREWVFNDVLRSIREKGGYISPAATSQQVRALMAERETLLNYVEFSSNNDRIGVGRVLKWYKKQDPNPCFDSYALLYAVAGHTNKLANTYTSAEWKAAIEASPKFKDLPHYWPWPAAKSLCSGKG